MKAQSPNINIYLFIKHIEVNVKCTTDKYGLRLVCRGGKGLVDLIT